MRSEPAGKTELSAGVNVVAPWTSDVKRCLLMALFGHNSADACLLLRVKRIGRRRDAMSAHDPKRTSRLRIAGALCASVAIEEVVDWTEPGEIYSANFFSEAAYCAACVLAAKHQGGEAPLATRRA